jgi:predicted nucleic-acid-binding Zn-ribbon protein
MKESATCPKCDGRRLWVIERFRVPSDHPEGTPLSAVLDQPEGGGIFRSVRAVGGFDMHICGDCGFSELWARDIEGLVARPSEGVRLDDQSDPEQGPFR